MKRINNILTKVFKKFGLWALQNFGEIMGLGFAKFRWNNGIGFNKI